MFGLKDISIEFLTGNPVLVGLAFVVLILLSLLLYFKTNPPLPLHFRILLGGLRVIAMLALIGALFEPVISFSREYNRNVRVAVLLDKSSSMDRQEPDKSRAARLDSLMSCPDFSRLKASADVETYYFGENVDQSSDLVNRDKTALGEALHELSRRELAEPSDFWFLFSDGNSNSGRQPADAARGLSVPVYSIDMAQDAGSFDVALSAVDFNPVVFVGQKTEMKVKLNWHSARGQRFTVQLRHDTRILDESHYTLSQEDGLGEVTLSYVPAEPGQRLLQVQIPILEEEETGENNQRTVAVKVLKSRLTILLVTAHPDYEVGFLNRYLKQSEKYDVDLIVTGPKAGNLFDRFPASQTELNRYDLVILHDPEPSSLEAYQEIIKSYLSERGGAIWVTMGRQFAESGPVPWFNRLLPFSQSSQRGVDYGDFHGQPAEGNLFHPAVRLADDRSGIREVWADLPPFRSLVRCDQTDLTGVVLAYASGPGLDRLNIPILGYKRFGPGKLLSVAALPMWHWSFINLGFGEDDSHYGTLLEGVISWLTVPEDFDPIRIAPDKEVFNRGEQIRFEGFAFDQGFRPIPGVTGVVQIMEEESHEAYEADLIEHGEGKFRALYDQVPPGRYHYKALFEKEGQVLKQREGRIQVEPFSLEEYDQDGDPSTLMAVARLSGGDYFTCQQFAQAVSAVDLSPITESQEGEIVIWGRLWLLLIFIGSLGLEWVLRKLNDLI